MKPILKQKSVWLGLALIGMFVLGTVTTQFALKHNNDPFASSFKAAMEPTPPICSSIESQNKGAISDATLIGKTLDLNGNLDSLVIKVQSKVSGHFYAALQNGDTLKIVNGNDPEQYQSYDAARLNEVQPYDNESLITKEIKISGLATQYSNASGIFVGFLADGKDITTDLVVIPMFSLEDSVKTCIKTSDSVQDYAKKSRSQRATNKKEASGSSKQAIIALEALMNKNIKEVIQLLYSDESNEASTMSTVLHDPNATFETIQNALPSLENAGGVRSAMRPSAVEKIHDILTLREAIDYMESTKNFIDQLPKTQAPVPAKTK